MKLATSTGDFSFYVPTVAEKVRNFKASKFKKYCNLFAKYLAKNINEM